MNREEVERKLQQLLKETLNRPSEEVIPAEAALVDYGLDSMNAIHFSLTVEEHFGIVYDAEELAFQNFSTAKRIADGIEAKLLTLGNAEGMAR